MHLTPVETANQQDLQKPCHKQSNPFHSQVSSQVGPGSQHLEDQTPTCSKIELKHSDDDNEAGIEAGKDNQTDRYTKEKKSDITAKAGDARLYSTES